MQQILSNIRRVEAIESFHLRHSDYVASQGVFLNVLQLFKEIPIIGLASATVKDKIENNQRIFTTELSFRTCTPLLPEPQKLCFLLTTVSGDRYLLGSHQRPYPLVTNSQNFPGSASAASGNVVKVDYTGPFPLLKVLD